MAVSREYNLCDNICLCLHSKKNELTNMHLIIEEMLKLAKILHI